MRPANRWCRLFAVLLVLAALGSGFVWMAQVVEAAACESAQTDYCVAQRDDAEPWGIAAIALAVPGVLLFVAGQVLSSRGTRD